MLSSFLFHELSVKGGSVESGGEGILAPDNMNEYSMEEEEDDSFQVRYISTRILWNSCWICVMYI